MIDSGTLAKAIFFFKFHFYSGGRKSIKIWKWSPRLKSIYLEANRLLFKNTKGSNIAMKVHLWQLLNYHNYVQFQTGMLYLWFREPCAIFLANHKCECDIFGIETHLSIRLGYKHQVSSYGILWSRQDVEHGDLHWQGVHSWVFCA